MSWLFLRSREEKAEPGGLCGGHQASSAAETATEDGLSGRRAGPGSSARPPGRQPRVSDAVAPPCGPAPGLRLRPLFMAALGVPPAPTARWRLRLPERQAPRHPSRRLSVFTPEIWLSASVLFFKWQKKGGLKVLFSA